MRMKATWSKDFPRLYDLYCQSDQHNKANWFADFDEVLENPLARPHFERLEGELGQLDDEAWRELKQKVSKSKYVTVRENLRGWRQLFSILSEVKGYLYLKSEGYEVRFIPEEKGQTPDLYGYGRSGTSGVLMEVKTINISDCEIKWRKANSEIGSDGKRHMTAKQVRTGLGDSLEKKILDTINRAMGQLKSYPCNCAQRKIVYLIINPDRLLALDSRNIYGLIAFLEKQGNNQVEIKYCVVGSGG